jgi:glycerol-3-phosphate dehydrogenase (NAD(P)+)
MKRLGVLGTGSWGTALAAHLAVGSELEVTLWGRSLELVEELRRSRRNERYLPGIDLPESLGLTADLDEIATSDILMVVVPSHGFRDTVRQLLPHLPAAGQPPVLVSATKGIETESLARMSEVTAEEAAKAHREVHFAVLTGPSFAIELAQGTPTAAVMASQDKELAETLQHELSSRTLRLYSTTDVVGVELGGTTKNVIAIAAGVVAGLGLGHNTQAALLTRGLHEIVRLVLACGGKPRTMAGLAGMGDLVLTCTGGLSRNRQLGMALAAGKSREEISQSSPMVAEGVLNSLAVARLAQRQGVEMPITEQMVEVIHHGKSPHLAVEELMNRELRSETEL